MITDEQCLAKGGHIETERDVPPSRDHPDGRVSPFRVCRVPNPSVGQTCRGEADCHGARCMCTGALARPNPSDDPALVKLDHTAGTGVCSEAHLPDGSWFCMVEGGTIHLAGIIID